MAFKNKYTWQRVIGTLAFAVFNVSMVHAGGAIESVSSFIQSGTEVVRIEFSEAPEAAPEGFSVQSPARIALDFPDVENATGKTRFDMNHGNLRAANIVQTAGRTRVVLSLKQSTPYRAEVQGKAVVVVLEPVERKGTVDSTSAGKIFSGRDDVVHGDMWSLKDVDFRRGTDGAGRLIVELGSDQVGVDLQQQGAGLLLELQNAVLPEGLRRRLDVSDFGTPIQLVTASQEGDRARLMIEAVGEWEHSAYQRDSQFILEVRPKKVDLHNFMQGPVYIGEKLSLNFQNVEVRSLLQVIADFTDFNIVTSDTVNGTLTLRLKDVPWDQALQIIMDARGLGMRKTGSVLWIAPKDEIDERTRKDYEAADALRKLEPVRTQSFQLNYAKADILVRQLTAVGQNNSGESGGGRFLSERGSAIAEIRTNQIFVTDIPAKLEEVRRLLLTLDVPVRQIMIEARIVEARDSFGRALGVRLGGGDLRSARGGDGGYSIGGDHRVAFGNNYRNATGAGLGSGADMEGNFVNLPAAMSGVESVGSFALSIFNPAANRFLTLELSAMEADGQGKIVSSPRIITADQAKALIEQGTDIPYATTDKDGNPTTSFKKAVLKLEVTPQITPEGDVILDLDVNKDSPGVTTDAGPAIDTKHIQTQVLVENGGTVVIGGIFEMEENTQRNKVPFFGDIPVVGNLFKNRLNETSKREMLVFITPRVISDTNSVR